MNVHRSLALRLRPGLASAPHEGIWFGVWRLRRGRQKVIKDFTVLVSLLVAAYFVLKAANYWLSRYALTTSQRGPVTGASYTDAHAALPAKYVMMAIGDPSSFSLHQPVMVG